jgi:hypothetical protein
MSAKRHNGILRQRIESACRVSGRNQSALTVLSTRIDP